MTPEATEWLALHRAHEGGVTKLGSNYANFGRPVAGYLAEVFDDLISKGFLALGQPSPSEQQQVCVTHIGHARYLQLDGRTTRAGTGVVSDGGRPTLSQPDHPQPVNKERSMTTALVNDPVASGSEQFGLSRPRQAPLCHDVPSPPELRPWGLRGMRRGAITGRAVPAFVYCHEQQVAVDKHGRPLVVTGMADPSADSVTDGDGDEGRSEDWVYDFVPDNPSPA